MAERTFDDWLRELDLGFWGTAQHKVTGAQFFERQASEGAVLLDVRSPQEGEQLALPFALQIPMAELPARWREVPSDRLVATWCSAGTRAAIAYAYLQLRDLSNVRVFAGSYHELVDELETGKVHKRLAE